MYIIPVPHLVRLLTAEDVKTVFVDDLLHSLNHLAKRLDCVVKLWSCLENCELFLAHPPIFSVFNQSGWIAVNPCAGVQEHLLRNSDGKIAIGDDPTGGYGTFIGQSELLLYTTVNRALDNKAGLLRPNQYQGLKGVSVEVVVLV